MNNLKSFIVYIVTLAITVKTVNSINCYQCSGTDSDNPFECNEYLDHDIDLEPTDCANIHGAQFCIKTVGRFEGTAIECYQCSTSTTMECGDGFMKLNGGNLQSTSCEHVYNAQYCIKEIGGIATKRYCSSLDLGNQCNYVQQPGDKLEYRTCVYTCSTDGCNGAGALSISAAMILTVVMKVIFI